MSNTNSALTVNFSTNLLTILFVGLKLTKHIDWNWWWVLAPTWIPWAIALAILILLGICAIISHLIK